MNTPLTSGQFRYYLSLQSPKPIVVVTGPAGTGKTLLACDFAMNEIYKYNQARRVLLTRPIVAADESIGYLPGDVDNKMEPWTKPMYDIFGKYLTKNQMDRHITIEPLGYMRGRTFSNSIIIADEMQNSTFTQMRLLLTRIGEDSKLIITGDLNQSDLGSDNGLEQLLYKMDGLDLDYITHVNMDTSDVKRHPAVEEILKVVNM